MQSGRERFLTAIFPADLATRLPLFVLEFRQEFPGSQATDAEIEAAGAASVYGSRGAGLVPVEGGDDKRLAAMNQFLHHGLLEAGCPRHIEWGNRSLQEFYAGLYLVKYAGPQDVVPL